MKAILLLAALILVGCGERREITGKVIRKIHTPESTWMMPVQSGDITMLIPQTSAASYHVRVWVVTTQEVEVSVSPQVYNEVAIGQERTFQR